MGVNFVEILPQFYCLIRPFWGANKYSTTKDIVEPFGFQTEKLLKTMIGMRPANRVYWSCYSFFSSEMRSSLCDFKMHACIALNIFALHLERPCTSKSIRNTIHKMCVFLPACLRSVSAIYVYTSTFNSWFIFVVCFLTYFALFICCFSRLFISFHFFRLLFLFVDFVSLSLELLHCRLCNQKLLLLSHRRHSHIAIRDISRWCYKMGIVVCVVSNFDAFLTYVSLPSPASQTSLSLSAF